MQRAAVNPRQHPTDIGPEDWRALRLLALYRLVVVTVLVILFESGYSMQAFADLRVGWFYNTCIGYGLAALLLIAPALYRLPQLTWQAHIQFGVDALAVVSLTYAAGGVTSGLGMLLITPAIGCSLVLSPRMAIVQAAVASLMLLGEEAFRQLQEVVVPAEFTQAGLLGLMLFLSSGAANAVATRARRSEAMAERAGSELANLSRLNETIVERMQSGVAVLDASGRFHLLNAAARDWLRARPGDALAPDTPLAQALARWRTGARSEPQPLRPREGTDEVIPRFSHLGEGAEAPVLILLESARAAQEQAQQIKLAALGRLSASIAHEIRNPLAAISHAGQLLGESTVLAAEDRKLLDIVQRHGARIDQIVRDVLHLSRRDTSTPVTIDLAPWLRQAVHQYGEGREAATRLRAPELTEDFRVRFDPSHLQQVLGNLWDNSLEHAGGSAEVRMSVRRLTRAGAPVLEVSDTGNGIAAELQERIFEPFFTTSTQGTGLGLYLARELCAYNQAQLIYVPRERGACFHLTFSEA